MKPILALSSVNLLSINSGYFFLKKDIKNPTNYQVEVLTKENWASRRKKASPDEIFQLKKIIELTNKRVFSGSDEQLQAVRKRLADGVKKHNGRKVRVLKFLLIPWLIATIFKIDTFASYQTPLAFQKKVSTTPDSPQKISSEERLEQASAKLENFIKTLSIEDALSLYQKIKSKLGNEPTNSLDGVIQALFKCEIKRADSNDVCASLLVDLHAEPRNKSLTRVINLLDVDVLKELIKKTLMQTAPWDSLKHFDQLNEKKIEILLLLLGTLTKPEIKTELVTLFDQAKLLKNSDFQAILKIFPEYIKSLNFEQLVENAEKCSTPEDRKRFLTLLDFNQGITVAVKLMEKFPEHSLELFDLLPGIARGLSNFQLEILSNQLRDAIPDSHKTFNPKEWELMKQFAAPDRKTRLEKFTIILAPYLGQPISTKLEALCKGDNSSKFEKILLDIQLFNFYCKKSPSNLKSLDNFFYVKNIDYFSEGFFLIAEKLKAENKEFNFSNAFENIYSFVDMVANGVVLKILIKCFEGQDLDLKKQAFIAYCLSEKNSTELKLSSKFLAPYIKDKQTLVEFLEVIPKEINSRIREKILDGFFHLAPPKTPSEDDETEENPSPLCHLSSPEITEVIQAQTGENLECMKTLGLIP